MPDVETANTEAKAALEEIKTLWTRDLKALQEKAHENGENLAEATKRDGMIKEQVDKVEAGIKLYEDRLAKLEVAAKRPSVTPSATLDNKADGLWVTYRKGAPSFEDTPENRDAARKAWATYLRKSRELMTPDELKLLSTQDNENGGYLVIPEFANELITELANVSPIRAVARVRTTSSNVWSIPKRTGRATGGWVGEGETGTESNSTYGRENIPNGKIFAFSRATQEEVADASFNLEQQIRADFVEEFAYREGIAFVNGTGLGKPEGLWTNASVLGVVQGDSATALTYQGLVRVSHGDAVNGDFNPQYLRNGRFLMSSTTLGSVRLLEDTAGQLVWTPNAAAGSPAMILGYPYSIVPDAPAIAGNAYPVIFGDIAAAYTIIDRVMFELMRNPYSEDTAGIVRFTAFKRVGGQVVQPAAIRKLKIATS